MPTAMGIWFIFVGLLLIRLMRSSGILGRFHVATIGCPSFNVMMVGLEQQCPGIGL